MNSRVVHYTNFGSWVESDILSSFSPISWPFTNPAGHSLTLT